MVASTGATLAAARFGLAPTVKKQATAGLKLVDKEVPLVTGDPAGEQRQQKHHQQQQQCTVPAGTAAALVWAGVDDRCSD